MSESSERSVGPFSTYNTGELLESLDSDSGPHAKSVAS